MLRFIVKRSLYSALVVAGVVLLTFVLFRLAAGDPAAAVLGKNPSPREVDDLRLELGADLPLIYGSWCKTEAFTTVIFEENRNLPGVDISGEQQISNGSLELKNGAILLKRNFEQSAPLESRILFQGNFVCDGKTYSAEKWTEVAIGLNPGREALRLDVPAAAQFQSIIFFRQQASAFNSQFIKALGEICSFKAEFPYVTFFNFGRTIVTREPIKHIIWRGVWPSLWLMTPIFWGELALGIILALIATAFKGGWVDRTLVLLSIAGMSVSYLVFIIFGQWYLGYYFNLFPIWGWGSARHLILPVLIGIFSGLGGGVRFYRAVFVNELNREYLRTATAKGCSKISIYGRHLLRNASIPIITRATAALPFLFTGSLLLETFFGVPGLGYAGIDALNNSDLQLLKALVIISAMLFVVINLLADIAYAWADPRIRIS